MKYINKCFSDTAAQRSVPESVQGAQRSREHLPDRQIFQRSQRRRGHGKRPRSRHRQQHRPQRPDHLPPHNARLPPPHQHRLHEDLWQSLREVVRGVECHAEEMRKVVRRPALATRIRANFQDRPCVASIMPI